MNTEYWIHVIRAVTKEETSIAWFQEVMIIERLRKFYAKLSILITCLNQTIEVSPFNTALITYICVGLIRALTNFWWIQLWTQAMCWFYHKIKIQTNEKCAMNQFSPVLLTLVCTKWNGKMILKFCHSLLLHLLKHNNNESNQN